MRRRLRRWRTTSAQTNIASIANYSDFDLSASRDDWQVNCAANDTIFPCRAQPTCESATNEALASNRCYYINPQGATRVACSSGDFRSCATLSIGADCAPIGGTGTCTSYDIDGVVPDDQRRLRGNVTSPGFQWPPNCQPYVYESLQGATVAATILQRYDPVNYAAWDWGNHALERAYVWLNSVAKGADGNFCTVTNPSAEGDDDLWSPWLVNYYEGTSFTAPAGGKPGKGMGFTAWTHAGPAPACPACSNGVKDCGEADVDCGRASTRCSACSVGDSCATSEDCASGLCAGSVCVTPIRRPAPTTSTTTLPIATPTTSTTMTGVTTSTIVTITTTTTTTTTTLSAASGTGCTTNADCDDGVGCTVDRCENGTGLCDHAPTNALCANGLYCDGAETCDATLGCRAGTPVSCGDAVACTADSCNETTDACDHVANNSACSDGLFCNGAETCDATLGCRAGTPVSCGDAVACTADSCNETTDACDHVANNALCSDGLFCNGAETCDATLGCRAGTPVSCGDAVACTTDSCNETTDACDHVANNSACSDGLFCNGAETCDATLGCRAGTPVSCGDAVACTADSCNETTDACDHVANNSLCSDGLFCNGAETCDATLGCRAGTPVSCGDAVACTADSCNETTDACDHVANNSACSDGLFCNGSEICNATLGCQGGSNPCGAGQTCNESTDVCQNASGPVTFGEVKSGASTNSTSVTTTVQLTGVINHLYLAVVGYRQTTTSSAVAVSGVSGLGLTWTQVATQCSGRNLTGISVWKAQGTPSGNGTVTATLTRQAAAAAISVSRYSGASTTNPLGSVVRSNTRGASGACTGGVDSASYTMSLPVTAVNGLAFGAATMRDKSHTPGAGYTERIEVHAGSGGTAASAANEDRAVVAAPSTLAVNGTFRSATDWAAVALEIR